MRIIFFIIIIIFITLSNFSIENENFKNDDKIVEKIYDILIKEYDNYKDKSFEEKFVLKLGKKTFIESLSVWKTNYKDLDSIKIILNYHLENMAQIVEKYSEKGKATNFRNNLENLTRLGYKNMQLYYFAVKEYLIYNNLDFNNITISLIDDSLCNEKYFIIKKKMYSDEREIKKELISVMHEDKLKFRMAFYAFAFNFFNKIREKVIDKDLQKMEDKIKKKKT